MQHLSSKKGVGAGRPAPNHSPGNSQTANDPDTSNYAVTSSPPAINEQGEIEIAGRRYVRQQRLARILGVTARTLARWNSRGIGPPKITIGKPVLFDLAKLPDWLAARETAPTRNTRR
jgi:hypothetical protein